MVVCVVPPVGVSRFASASVEAPADGDTVAVEIAIWDTGSQDSGAAQVCRSTNTVQFTYAGPSGVRLEVTTTKTVTATTATSKTPITLTSTATTATTSSTAATTTAKRCPHLLNWELGRCGPSYGNLGCPDVRSPYCNANNGYCGSTDAYRDAQESTEYDFCDDESDTGNDITNVISNDDAENDESSANNDDAGGDSSNDGAATTVGSKVAGDPNSQNQHSTNTTANSSSDRFNNTAVLGGGGNDDDDYGGDDDAVASAAVNQTSLIVGVVLGVVFLIAASVGLTICIQKRKSGAEAHAIPTQAVLTNFKARDQTESEGGQ